VPEFTLADIDRYNANRSVAESAYRARIEFVRPVTTVAAGTLHEQELLVVNEGTERWPWGPDAAPPIRLGYRWRDAGGEPHGEGRSAFSETVGPGARSLVKLAVQTPPKPGRYVLEADVVHEHVRWFDCPARLELEVQRKPAYRPRRRRWPPFSRA
jgi:hypothetical protein